MGGILGLSPPDSRASCAHPCHPTEHPAAAMVSWDHFHMPDRGYFTIWLGLHRTLLHHVIDLAPSVLLPLWLFGAGPPDPDRHVCGDVHRADTYPANVRGLPLVVAFLLGKRVFSTLRFPLCLPVLQHSAAHHQDHLHDALLWVHVPR